MYVHAGIKKTEFIIDIRLHHHTHITQQLVIKNILSLWFKVIFGTAHFISINLISLGLNCFTQLQQCVCVCVYSTH